MDVLLLVNNYFGFFPEKLDCAYVSNLYRERVNDSRILRGLRKFHLMSPIFFKQIWFKKWYKLLDSISTIVLFDNGNIDCVSNWIHKYNPQIRIIIWYWGPAKLSFNSSKIDRNICEIWSFDEDDCKKFDFKHNTQFFIPENIRFFKNNSSKDCLYDVLFVGTEKNRLDELINLECFFRSLGINYKFHVVKSKKKYISKENYNYSKPVDYATMLEMISKSKAVLDIVATNQTGMTLRPLEALFLKKKLITNDLNVMKYDIYNPRNIFVLGVDKKENLKAFLNSDYDNMLNDELMCKYGIKKWIERFDCEKRR